MKSRQQKQKEAIARNLHHVSKYSEQALEKYPPSGARAEQATKQILFIRHKLGIPKHNSGFDIHLIPALKAASKEAA